MKRVTVVVGHYGSGKSEFSVSLAMQLARSPAPYARVALADLDVANPYFRSRECRGMLEKAGVAVHSGAYDREITAELPALGAGPRAMLEDESCRAILDLGGNDAGARVLKQFGEYLKRDDHELLAVVNFNRYETRSVADAAAHVRSIGDELALRVDGIVNNTHLLLETTPDIIRRGYEQALELSRNLGIPLICTCYPAPLVEPRSLLGVECLMPLGLYLRPTYLDCES